MNQNKNNKSINNPNRSLFNLPTMSPQPNTSTIKTVKSSNARDEASVKRFKKYSSEMNARWFDANKPNVSRLGLKLIKSEKMRVSYFPNNAGVMKMFPTPFGLRMMGVKLISGVDENNKLCIALEPAQYEFYKTMQDELMGGIIPNMKSMFTKYAESEPCDTVRVSEHSEKPYIKTKVQLNGTSRTIGSGVDGENAFNHAEALRVPGTTVNVKIGISGVYLTSSRCGLITSISMYNVVDVPDEEAIAEEKESIREEFESFRAEALRNF